MVVVMFVLSVAVFSLLYLSPGGPEYALLGDTPPSPEAIHAIRLKYHLDDPLPVQYGRWISGAVRFDFGDSILTGEPVTSVILEHWSVSLALGVYAFVLTLGVGVSLGVLSALKQGSAIDQAAVSLSVIGTGTPAFYTSIVLIYLFGVVLRWFPVYGMGEDWFTDLWHLTLPAIALALTGMALAIRITRAATITTLQQDYVGFARSRGLSEVRVLFAYEIRNALGPVATAGGIIFSRLIVGAVLVEVTFALPGLGNLLVSSVMDKDIPVVQGTVVFVGAVIVIVNLCVDFLYMAIDPRVRFERVAA